MRVTHDNKEKQQWQLIDTTNRLANLEAKNLEINRRRDKREGWLFWVAIASLFVAGGSLYVAALTLHFALLK